MRYNLPRRPAPYQEEAALIPNGLGGPELVIILILVIIVFKFRSLPSIGASLGKSLRGFKDGLTGHTDDDPKQLHS
jgi:sec-independent protein translocase protein TatA